MEKEGSSLKTQLMYAAQAGNWIEVERLASIPQGCMKTYTPTEYLQHFKEVARCFAFATHDESWHEFDKEFAIIIKRMLRAEKCIEKYVNRYGKIS
jgi:hypothetical protein